jgi:hypothetical protein
MTDKPLLAPLNFDILGALARHPKMARASSRLNL